MDQPPSLLQHTQIILDHLGVGTLFVAAHGSILYASQHSGVWLGCESDQIRGLYVITFIHRDHKAIFQKHFHSVLDGELRESRIPWRCGDTYRDIVVRMKNLLQTPIKSVLIVYRLAEHPSLFNGGEED